MFTVDTSEIDELIADLGDVGRQVEQPTKDSVRHTAEDTQRDGRTFAPKLTGYLADSITVDISPDGMSSEVGPEASYGDYVERGTSVMAPQPYMGPAHDKNEPAFFAESERIADQVLG